MVVVQPHWLSFGAFKLFNCQRVGHPSGTYQNKGSDFPTALPAGDTQRIPIVIWVSWFFFSLGRSPPAYLIPNYQHDTPRLPGVQHGKVTDSAHVFSYGDEFRCVLVGMWRIQCVISHFVTILGKTSRFWRFWKLELELYHNQYHKQMILIW